MSVEKEFIEKVVADILLMETATQPVVVNEIYEKVLHARRQQLQLAEMRLNIEKSAIETFKYKNLNNQ